MSYEYTEVVKSIFLKIKHSDCTRRYGSYAWDYKIEVYKKHGYFYSLLFRKEEFDLINANRFVVSESFYVDKSDMIPILEERPFKDPNECLNFALEQLYSLK